MKFFSFFLIFLSLFVFVISGSYANNCSFDGGTIIDTIQGCADGTKGLEAGEGQSISSLRERVVDIASGAMRYAALFSVGVMVVAGIMYVTAYGREEQLNTAKKTAVFAGIGLIIALLAFSVVNAIMYFIYGIGK